MTHPADLQRHVGRFYGKYRGVVTAVADPKKLGRISVQVPAVFPNNLEVQAEACFPAGHFWVPPVGAKVWIEFEAGDPAHPLWTGGWYTDGTPPTEAALDPPDGRIVHSPSGHMLRFHDTAGEEKVVLRHKSDSFVSIDENGSVLVGAKDGAYVFLNVDQGEVSVVSKQGHMVTMTDEAVTVAHHGGALVVLGDDVKVSSPGKVIVNGKDIVLSGGSISLGGSGAQFKLLTDAFAKFYAAHTHGTAVGASTTPLPPYLPAPPFETQTVKTQATP